MWDLGVMFNICLGLLPFKSFKDGMKWLEIEVWVVFVLNVGCVQEIFNYMEGILKLLKDMTWDMQIAFMWAVGSFCFDGNK